MLHRVLSYIRQRPIGVLALVVALGGTGAYAASGLGGGQARGFAVAAGNASGSTGGTLAKLGGLTLKWRSVRAIDGRTCTLTARSTARADLGYFYAVQPSGAPKSYVVAQKRLAKDRSHDVVAARFDEGAPGISRLVEGQLTFHAGSGPEVVTALFHVAAQSKRCLFQGTLTGAD